MKDSQRALWDRLTTDKYIKESNERFSTISSSSENQF